MSIKKILNIIIICTILAFSAGIASAESPLNFPVWLWGNVNIDGNPAPVGTTIITKAGTSPAGSTTVLTSGTYGVKENNSRLPVSASSDGAQIDFYVNGIKATPSTTFIYYLSDGSAGKLIRVDLNALSGTSGTNDRSGGSGGSGGGVSAAGGTPKATVIQQSVSPKESISGTPATGTPVTTPGGEAPVFGWSTVLGVFGLLAIGAIIIFALKKMGKI